MRFPKNPQSEVTLSNPQSEVRPLSNPQHSEVSPLIQSAYLRNQKIYFSHHLLKKSRKFSIELYQNLSTSMKEINKGNLPNQLDRED